MRRAGWLALLAALAALAGGGCRANGNMVANRDGAMADGSGSPPMFASAMNTLPFDGGVYFVGYWAQQMGLQRFWPTRATSYYTGFDPAPTYLAFRPTDGQLFYSHFAYGIHIDDSAAGPDSPVPTPPCVPTPDSPFLSANIDTAFGFDGQGLLYYACDGVRRRGNGEAVGGQQAGFVGVLADGRSVVVIADANGDPNTLRFAAMAPDGRILSDLKLGSPPPYVPNADSITVRGNDAFVLVTRIEYDSNMTPTDAELVGYRLDPQSNWLKVRSIPYVRPGRYWDLLLSDGTVLMWSQDKPDPGAQVIAFLPDGTQRTVWHQADSPGVQTSIPQLVVGPRQPSGPSLRQE